MDREPDPLSPRPILIQPATAWRMLLVLGMLGAIAHVIFAMGSKLGGRGDDAVYLVMADSFHNQLWGTSLPSEFVWRYTQFPPLYPMFLALLGSNSGEIRYAHTISALLNVATTIFFYRWIVAQNVFSSAGALAVAGIWLLLPQTLSNSMQANSEPLYDVLLLSALLAYEKSENRPTFLSASAFISILAVLTRSVGIIAAFSLIVHYWRRRGRNAPLFAVAIAVPLTIWFYVDARYFGAGQVYFFASFENRVGRVVV